MELVICNVCGSELKSDDSIHYYKHDRFPIKIKADSSSFQIDADLYTEELVDGPCEYQYCGKLKKHHIRITHQYIGKQIPIRKIKFIIPDETKCKKCGITVLEHKDMDKYIENYQTFHYFDCDIDILNKRDTDIVDIQSSDYKTIKNKYLNK